MKALAVTTLCFFLLDFTDTAYAVPPPESSEILIAWNETVLGVAENEDAFLTLKGLRTVTMAHIAMHDALNSVEAAYGTYAYDEPAKDANVIAAINEAAYRIAVDQYSDQSALFADLRTKWLATIPDGAATKRGITVGANAAAAILRLRNGDGWDTTVEYRFHPMAPGVYAEFREHSDTPQGFVFGAGWGNAKGFALTRPDQFRSPPPPEITGAEYTRAFNEVKEVGRFQSMSRTPDQTHLALWWKDFAENAQNRLARDLVKRENLPLIESARLFALLNISIFDAYVGVFDNKFFYNHWRPYTAIRWAEHDGNPDTVAEDDWTNTHRHTYAFPSYPSAHGTACAASATAFESVFGNHYAFTMRTPVVDVAGPLSEKIHMHPESRKFGSFSEAANECAMSRVYLGIHFRYDSVAGLTLGKQIGRNAVARFLIKR